MRYAVANQRASTPQACSPATKQPSDPTQPQCALSTKPTGDRVSRRRSSIPSERVRSTRSLVQNGDGRPERQQVSKPNDVAVAEADAAVAHALSDARVLVGPVDADLTGTATEVVEHFREG